MLKDGERDTARVKDIVEASSSRKQACKLLWKGPNGELMETFKQSKEIRARHPVGSTIETWVEDLR